MYIQAQTQSTSTQAQARKHTHLSSQAQTWASRQPHGRLRALRASSAAAAQAQATQTFLHVQVRCKETKKINIYLLLKYDVHFNDTYYKYTQQITQTFAPCSSHAAHKNMQIYTRMQMHAQETQTSASHTDRQCLDRQTVRPYLDRRRPYSDKHRLCSDMHPARIKPETTCISTYHTSPIDIDRFCVLMCTSVEK